MVNVAGITRPDELRRRAREEDWRGVLAVHLDGYLNVLDAALPIMAAAGHGRILGVTSGSGWRPADTGAYGCAKRAVAALTWQLGRQAPPGRRRQRHVADRRDPDGHRRARPARRPRQGRRASATGGLSLGSMPAPEELGPLGAHLVGDDFAWCRGRVLFAGGSEVAVIDEPRLLEVVRTDDVTSLAARCSRRSPPARSAPAEAQPGEQRRRATRGSAPIFDEPAGDLPAGRGRARARSSPTDPEVAAAVTAALEARGVTCTASTAGDVAAGFAGAADALASTVARAGPLDAVVVALAGPAPATGSTSGWERVLAEHAGIVEQHPRRRRLGPGGRRPRRRRPTARSGW